MAQWDDSENQNPDAGSDAPQSAYDPYARIRALYQQVSGGAYTPSDAEVSQWGTNIDANYLQKIQGAIGQWWQQRQAQQPAAAPKPNPEPTPTPGPTGPAAPTTTNDIFSAPLTKMYDGQFTAPTQTNIGGPAGVGATPTFTPPPYARPDPFSFKAPSVEDALNEPGYKFRVDQGDRGIQNWAGAKGTLNDSSTAKALSDYNQGAAGAEYANVWNRSWNSQKNTYDTNYQTQFTDPWQIAFQGANVQNANNVLGYSTNAAATQHSNDTNYLNSWNQYLDKKNEFYNWQDRTFGKQFQVANA